MCTAQRDGVKKCGLQSLPVGHCAVLTQLKLSREMCSVDSIEVKRSGVELPCVYRLARQTDLFTETGQMWMRHRLAL